MHIELNQIKPETCEFKWRGTKLCYLSRGRLRSVAKDLGLSIDGVKREIYNRIVLRLEQSNSKAEITR